jgi:hypothetical protein
VTKSLQLGTANKNCGKNKPLKTHKKQLQQQKYLPSSKRRVEMVEETGRGRERVCVKEKERKRERERERERKCRNQFLEL